MMSEKKRRKRRKPVIAIDAIRSVARPDQLEINKTPVMPLMVSNSFGDLGEFDIDIDIDDPIFRENKEEGILKSTSNEPVEEICRNEKEKISTENYNQENLCLFSLESKCKTVATERELTFLHYAEVEKNEYAHPYLCKLNDEILVSEEKGLLKRFDDDILVAEEIDLLQRVDKEILRIEEKELMQRLCSSIGLASQMQRQGRLPSLVERVEEAQSPVCSIFGDLSKDYWFESKGKHTKARNGRRSIAETSTRRLVEFEERSCFILVTKIVPKFLVGRTKALVTIQSFKLDFLSTFRMKLLRCKKMSKFSLFLAFTGNIHSDPYSMLVTFIGKREVANLFLMDLGSWFCSTIQRYNLHTLLTDELSHEIHLQLKNCIGSGIAVIKPESSGGRTKTQRLVGLLLRTCNETLTEKSELKRIVGRQTSSSGAALIAINGIRYNNPHKLYQVWLGEMNKNKKLSIVLCVSRHANLANVDQTRCAINNLTLSSNCFFVNGKVLVNDKDNVESNGEVEGFLMKSKTINLPFNSKIEPSVDEHSHKQLNKKIKQASNIQMSKYAKPLESQRCSTPSNSKNDSGVRQVKQKSYSAEFRALENQKDSNILPDDENFNSSPKSRKRGRALLIKEFASPYKKKLCDKPFLVAFDSSIPLGFYCINHYGKEKECRIVSICPFGQGKKDCRVEIGTLIQAVVIEKKNHAIEGHRHLKNMYLQARKKKLNFHLKLVNSIKDFLIAGISNQDWAMDGAWQGSISNGWNGGAAPLFTKHSSSFKSGKITYKTSSISAQAKLNESRPTTVNSFSKLDRIALEESFTQDSRKKVTDRQGLQAPTETAEMPMPRISDSLALPQDTLTPRKRKRKTIFQPGNNESKRDGMDSKSVLNALGIGDATAEKSSDSTTVEHRLSKYHHAKPLKSILTKIKSKNNNKDVKFASTFEGCTYIKGSRSCALWKTPTSDLIPIDETDRIMTFADSNRTKNVIDAVYKGTHKDLLFLLQKGAGKEELLLSGGLQNELAYVKKQLYSLRGRVDELLQKDLEFKEKMMKIYTNAVYLIKNARNLKRWSRYEIAIEKIIDIQLSPEGQNRQLSVIRGSVRFGQEVLKNLPQCPISEVIRYNPNKIPTYPMQHNSGMLDKKRFLNIKLLGNDSKEYLGRVTISVDDVAKKCPVDGRAHTLNFRVSTSELLTRATLVANIKEVDLKPNYLKKKQKENEKKLHDIIDWIRILNSKLGMEKVRDFLQINGNIYGEDNLSLLHIAIYHGDEIAVRELLLLSANIHTKSSVGSAIFLAINMADRIAEKPKNDERNEKIYDKEIQIRRKEQRLCFEQIVDMLKKSRFLYSP